MNKRLVLATSHGRYNVSTRIERWDPVTLYFKNYGTAIIHSKRTLYDAQTIGSGAKYVVKFKQAGRADEVIPIYPGDHRVKKFRNFTLTEEALRSRDALEEFLFDQAASGNISCIDIEVLDHSQWRLTIFDDSLTNEIEAVPQSWFDYHVVDRLASRWYDFQNWRENRRRGVPNPRPKLLVKMGYLLLHSVFTATEKWRNRRRTRSSKSSVSEETH